MTRNQLSFFPDEDPGVRLIAGVDEVGRGPLAGDVVAAAVILDPDKPIRGLDDSKKLPVQAREKLYERIRQRALAWSVGRASVEEIDELNILWASMLAMKRAVEALPLRPELVCVDGNRCPDWEYRSMAVVQGDGRVQAIAAASIVAKVTRDRELEELDTRYPGYGLARHKGYATAFHLEALRRLGPCAIHRRSFQPVAEALAGVCGQANEAALEGAGRDLGKGGDQGGGRGSVSAGGYDSPLIPATLPADD